MPEEIHRRLRRVRKEHDLSLRRMAARVEDDGGCRVSHDSVRRYEEGRRVPSDYLTAVCSVFDVSPDWLLFGRGSMRVRPPSEAAEALKAVGHIVKAFRDETSKPAAGGWNRSAWKRWHEFVEGLSRNDPVSRMSVRSWEPAPDEGDEDGGSAGPPSHRVGVEERRSRVEAVSTLMESVRGHQDWLDLLFRDIAHNVSLLDGDGVIVRSVSSDEELAEEWNMEVGFDWSEDAAGPNGGGSALASGELSAVLGTEAGSFPAFACLGAPLHDPTGTIVGALSLSVRLPDANPARMCTVAYSARRIEEALTVRGEAAARAKGTVGPPTPDEEARPTED